MSSTPPLPVASDLDIAREHTDIVLHCFPSSGIKSKPVRLSVNGRKGKRAICVLFADMTHYEVLDIDYQAKNDGEE